MTPPAESSDALLELQDDRQEQQASLDLFGSGNYHRYERQQCVGQLPTTLLLQMLAP